MVAKRIIGTCYNVLQSSSSKIIDGSKTKWEVDKQASMSSSSKIIDGSKTDVVWVKTGNRSSSSKIIDGSKTVNLFF